MNILNILKMEKEGASKSGFLDQTLFMGFIDLVKENGAQFLIVHPHMHTLTHTLGTDLKLGLLSRLKGKGFVSLLRQFNLDYSDNKLIPRI